MECDLGQYKMICEKRFDKLDNTAEKILEIVTDHKVRLAVLENVKKPGIITALLMALGVLTRK